MKIVVENKTRMELFENIECGEVFRCKDYPNELLLRTDSDSWVAVDLESGVLLHKEDFDLDEELYYIVDAKVHVK